MGVIFDLDQTLVDTRKLKPFRDKRLWREIRSQLHLTALYPDVIGLVSLLSKHDVPMAVVTNSPSMYARSVLEYHSLPIKTLVAYHDTRNHKPHPEPMIKAVQLMGCSLSQVISLGDDPKDIQSSKNAGIIACAAFWDCDDHNALKEASPTHSFNTPNDFLKFASMFHCL